MERDWGLIGFLNGDLSDLVRAVLLSVVVVELGCGSSVDV